MAERTNTHFRELESVTYRENPMPPEFEQFVAKRILPRLKFEGYKLDEKKRIATNCIHNLILTGMVNAVVSDARDKKAPLRLHVWDKLIAAGFARVCVGSEMAGVVSRYRATGKLCKLREEWELRLVVDLHLDRNTELDEPTDLALVVLHTGKIDLATGEPLPEERRKQPVDFREKVGELAQKGPNGEPDPAAVQNALNYFRGIEDVIERINRENLSHSWQAFATLEDGTKRAFQPNPCLRQVHVGQFFRAARLYSWSQWSGQNLSKAIRRDMLIDGEPVAELDYSGMHPRMLYHLSRIEVKGDVYRPKTILPKFHGFKNATAKQKEIVRGFLKQATNICLNVNSRDKALAAIRFLLNKHEHRDTLTKIIEKTEGSNVSDLLDRICKAHPKLEGKFFTEIGLELMSTDGKIMMHIINAFSHASKPVLAIHDAVLCRVSDTAFARETMTEIYRQFIQFDPVIKQTF